jgi:predicted CoA-binding protein
MNPEIAQLLHECHTIAVVGMSPNPTRISHQIGVYLAEAGYKVIPVYPGQDEIAGLKCYSSLEDIPEPVDLVNVFRRPEFVMDVAQSAVEIGAKAMWLQEGVINIGAKTFAENNGLKVIMDRCIMVDHKYMPVR